MIYTRSCTAVLCVAAFLQGCAAPDGLYPSLAIRDSERVGGRIAAPEREVYQPPATSAASLTRSDQLARDAQAANAAFLAAVPQTRAKVRAARGAARNSDAWFSAQLAITDLEAARAGTLLALADLDRISLDAAVAGTQFDALAAQRDTVAAMAQTQTETIFGLLQSLAR